MTKLDLKCSCGAEMHIKTIWAAVAAEAYKAFAAVHDAHSTPPPSKYATPTVRGKNAFGYSKPHGKSYAH